MVKGKSENITQKPILRASYNDYLDEQKVKLAAATFSNYALVWWKKNHREMKREEGQEIDTWTEMRRVMRKRYVPTSYSRTMRQKLQRLF